MCVSFSSLKANFNHIFAFNCRRQSIATAGLGTGDSAPDFRQIRCTPDWSENAVAGDHLWSPTSMSVDYCYVGDSDCVVSKTVYELSLLGNFRYAFLPQTCIRLKITALQSISNKKLCDQIALALMAEYSENRNRYFGRWQIDFPCN